MADEHLSTSSPRSFDDFDVGDTVLRQQVHNLAARYRFAGERAGAPVLDTDAAVGVQLSEDAVWGNDVVLLRPLVDVDGLIRHLGEFAEHPSNVWSLWPLPDLATHGFDLMGHPPAMLRASGGTPPSVPPELEIVAADSDELIEAYDRTGIVGFPMNRPDGRPLDRLLTPNIHGGPWRFFVGFVDGTPVTAASVFVACAIAQVEYVATLPEYRGRGYGEAVTWKATLAEPDLPAVLIASDLGRPVYERMGYLAIQRFTLWYWRGAA